MLQKIQKKNVFLPMRSTTSSSPPEPIGVFHQVGTSTSFTICQDDEEHPDH